MEYGNFTKKWLVDVIKKFNFLLILVAIFIAGCKQPTLYSIDGVSTENTTSIVQLREGSMLLRGLDRKPLDTTKIPNPFSDYLFAFKPGVHSLWGMNIQGGHALFPENLRCYVISEVELKEGVIYRLEEDKEIPRAILRREDTGAQVATGQLVDQKAAYTDGCNWNR